MKYDFIDGSIMVPTDQFDPTFCAWRRCNMLVHSWIMNFIVESIGQSIVFMENAVYVWNDLKEHFSQGDLVHVSKLQQEIYALKPEHRMVTKKFSDLKILREELEMYMSIPTCTCCILCSWEVMRTTRYNHNLLYAIRFLTGLNEEFSVVKSQILLLDHLPSLNKIFSMVIQHERQIVHHVSVSDDSKILVNAAENRRSSFRNNKTGFKSGQRVCTFCDKLGHTVDTCYRKHGVPPHLQKKSSNYAAHNAAVESFASPDLTHE
ncbi:uncharacterized protein LOC127080648 [Lathyrus oleraceus]|uniref:uncharacterized protein LOC127080648 n=1 Tax=Pisum sativum TaxID=3888 RepID=UPI0021D1F388|nr:uncharacterized protein LOC127080648 [Pisum sativum]